MFIHNSCLILLDFVINALKLFVLQRNFFWTGQYKSICIYAHLKYNLIQMQYKSKPSFDSIHCCHADCVRNSRLYWWKVKWPRNTVPQTEADTDESHWLQRLSSLQYYGFTCKLAALQTVGQIPIIIAPFGGVPTVFMCHAAGIRLVLGFVRTDMVMCVA